MTSPKKILIPSADEVYNDGDTDAISVRRYFEPGKIITEANSTSIKESGAVAAADSSAHGDLTTENSAQQTAFERAFSSLKDSKYYETIEKEGQSLSKATEKVIIPTKTKSIIVNAKQKGNPLLKHIRNVPWEFGDIEPDYLVGQTTCVLFLSVKYHNLFPNYIHDRLKSLGKGYQLRVLLLQVDMSDPYPAVRELSRIAILTDFTLMCAWSAEEAGRYLETYKMFENKSPDLIMEKQDEDISSKVVNALSSVKSINQTDALMLLTTFGSLKEVVNASKEDMVMCPGMGQNKANKLFEVFHQPFLKPEKKSAPT